MVVSIPRSGFWVFKLASRLRGQNRRAEFQSLGRDSGCSSSNARPRRRPSRKEKFQSLGRDSGCSSESNAFSVSDQAEFQSLGRDSGCSSNKGGYIIVTLYRVSIPRSGFWVFKRRYLVDVGHEPACFNPSVGILGVQAFQPRNSPAAMGQFQSLGRDSGCSSLGTRDAAAGRSGVSIPRSGFWVFKRLRPPPGERRSPGFNPSVGILGVQACVHCRNAWQTGQFQSLGRDSGCSSTCGVHGALDD